MPDWYLECTDSSRSS